VRKATASGVSRRWFTANDPQAGSVAEVTATVRSLKEPVGDQKCGPLLGRVCTFKLPAP
jgi:hypothetical protein